jgi:hypothetical protein
MGILGNLFKRKKAKFNILDTADTVEVGSELLNDLFSRRLDGYIHRQFLSKEECDKLVGNFYGKVGYNKDPETPVIYPPNFYQIRNENVDEKYFQLAKDYIDEFPSTYGLDVHQRLFDLLKSVNANVNIKIPPGEENGYYQPTTFRSLPPNDVVMYAHCENQLREIFDEHCAYLSTMTDIYDSLSFFIMLKEPSEGGRLILYNVDWDRAKKNAKSRTNSVLLTTGEAINLDDKKSPIGNLKIDMQTGDLIIFPGGQLWHSVESVAGDKNRVTFGGFLSKGRNEEDTLYVWS